MCPPLDISGGETAFRPLVLFLIFENIDEAIYNAGEQRMFGMEIACFRADTNILEKS
jgi:hypothetical protein